MPFVHLQDARVCIENVTQNFHWILPILSQMPQARWTERVPKDTQTLCKGRTWTVLLLPPELLHSPPAHVLCSLCFMCCVCFPHLLHGIEGTWYLRVRPMSGRFCFGKFSTSDCYSKIHYIFSDIGSPRDSSFILQKKYGIGLHELKKRAFLERNIGKEIICRKPITWLSGG